jgi:alpha/beta superfamily hydrolase
MAAARHSRKTQHVIQDANHYYFGQADKAAEAADVVQRWIGSLR